MYPTLANLVLADNMATNEGGGLYINSSAPHLVNVIFTGTSANNGGGMSNNGGNPDLVNITFSRNNADSQGGGLYNWSSGYPTLANVILWGNTAATGAQIHNESGTPAISYSLVQGGCPPGAVCAHLSSNDPLFVDAGNDDLRLQATSPAIDAGDNTAVPAGITTDINGYERFVDHPDVEDTGNGPAPIVDMGACEEQTGAQSPKAGSVYLPVIMKQN
jgi:hypothetical protein